MMCIKPNNISNSTNHMQNLALSPVKYCPTEGAPVTRVCSFMCVKPEMTSLKMLYKILQLFCSYYTIITIIKNNNINNDSNNNDYDTIERFQHNDFLLKL